MNDNGGDSSSCNTASAGGLLPKYGISTMPTLMDGSTSMGVVTLASVPAGVDRMGRPTGVGAIAPQIAGAAPLGNCTFMFKPEPQIGTGTVDWSILTTDSKCTKYIKNSVAI